MTLLPTDPQQQQPPTFLDNLGTSVKSGLQSMGEGIQSRNLLPALALGAAIGLIPPLLYGKRSRRGAARAWGGIGTQLAFNELERPERERRTRQDALGRLVSSGMASTTGGPGASPLGNYGGIDVYQTPTMADRFPEYFKSSTSPAGGLTETDLGDGTTPPVPTPPTRRMNPAMQLFGSMPATPENLTAAAKFAQGQFEHDLALERSQQTRTAIEGKAKELGQDVSYGMGSDGEMTARTSPKRPVGSGKVSQIHEEIALENQRRAGQGLPPMSAEENLAFRTSRKGSLGKTLSEQAQQQYMRQESARLNREMSKDRDKITGMLLSIPRQFHAAADNLKTWQMLKNDPGAMKLIDEDTHGQIELLLDNYEDTVRERDDLFRSTGGSPSGNVIMPYDQKRIKPADLGQTKAAIRNDLREWGLK